jgi:2',3'-cyclic-nucleotide 2'-phosphodiesterase
MKIIFLGDVVGEPGRDAIREGLPQLIEEIKPDLIVVNGENAAANRGITQKLAFELMRCKVDLITLGDHVWDQKDVGPFLDQEPRVLRPFNFPKDNPGNGSVVVSGNGFKLGVISALGRTFMNYPVENPFSTIEAEIQKLKKETNCIFVDFHCEATAEKKAMGFFLDGKVSVMVGTHTHVQTADEMILAGGTGYITDVGFCGGHDSVIGTQKEAVLKKFHSLIPQRFQVESADPQLDGVWVKLDPATGKCLEIHRIQKKVKLFNG